jgi:thiol peroxidase
MSLEDTPLDVGYASDKVTISDTNGADFVIGGQNGKTQVFITSPIIDEAFIQELQKLQDILPKGGEHEVTAALIVPNKNHSNPKLENINFYIDSKEEFGDFYSVRLKGEPYNNEFTKAVIVISKDGAIFYDEFLDDLEKEFNQDTLYRKIFAAQTCYTGKGCH